MLYDPCYQIYRSLTKLEEISDNIIIYTTSHYLEGPGRRLESLIIDQTKTAECLTGGQPVGIILVLFVFSHTDSQEAHSWTR
jgi:hypothetical protein